MGGGEFLNAKFFGSLSFKGRSMFSSLPLERRGSFFTPSPSRGGRGWRWGCTGEFRFATYPIPTLTLPLKGRGLNTNLPLKGRGLNTNLPLKGREGISTLSVLKVWEACTVKSGAAVIDIVRFTFLAI